MRLLLREVQSGTVRVGGHDLNQLDADTLLSQIALVSQDIMLFHGTIEDNLRLPPDASREQLRAAASAANIDDFIMALPDGATPPASVNAGCNCPAASASAWRSPARGCATRPS